MQAARMEAPTSRSLALLALALVLSAPVLADAGQAQEDVDEDEPHVLVRVENDGAQAREIEVTIDGPDSFRDRVRVPAEGTWEHRHAGEPGSYTVEVVHEDEGSRARASTDADTAGCRGPTLASFALSANGGISVLPGGCRGEVPAFQALLDEARQARSADGSGEIDVPLPRDASQGRLLLWDELAEPDWADAGSVPFAWLANASFHDERGRSLDGAELTYVSPYHVSGRASSGPLFEAEASSAGVEDRLRFADGDPTPVTKTLPVSVRSSADPSGASAEIQWEIRYDAQPTLLDCLLRNAQQGQALEAGQTAGSPCPAADLAATWWTGEQATRRGFATVPQYGVDDPRDPTRVVALRWAHGLPYPLRAELVAVDDGSGAQRLVANLTNLTRAGQPLAADGATPDPVAIDRAPLAPLEGPQLGDDGRVPFPLAEASQAARQDPTLSELQALLADGDAILAGAHLSPEGTTDAGQARTLRWTLAYTAPGEGPALVTCRRPTGQAAGTSLTPPGADCREPDEPPAAAAHLAELPALGPEALPSRAATWDAALDRWRLLDPANASAPVALASYDPLAGEASQDPQRPRLLVGTPGQDPQPGPSESPEVPTTVSLALADGSTIAHRTGVKSHQGLADPAAALASVETADPGGDGLFGGGDPVVGAAGAGLLGLLALAAFALYSRLRGEEVLAHETREQIRELVADDPGIHGKEIARRVDANERTVEHHVDVLVREDVLTELERGGYNHYFVKGEHPPRRMQALASLQRGQAETVYETVRRSPGVDLTSLAEAADISKPYASKLVDQLVDVGLVDRVREGRSARLYANELDA